MCQLEQWKLKIDGLVEFAAGKIVREMESVEEVFQDSDAAETGGIANQD